MTTWYIVTEDCIGCGMCKEACYLDAVEYKGDYYAINPNECYQCNWCLCENECPVEAVKKKD